MELTSKLTFRKIVDDDSLSIGIIIGFSSNLRNIGFVFSGKSLLHHRVVLRKELSIDDGISGSSNT